MEPITSSEDGNKATRPTAAQKGIALLVAAATLSYLILITTGTIRPADRLSVPEVGLLFLALAAIALALKPGLIERLEKFELAGIKFDLTKVREEQAEVRKQQQVQADILEDVRLALRLLVGDKEREHLMNLYRNKTHGYSVTGAFREEVRRLRAVKLIQMRDGATVHGIPDKTTFDLARFVELTEEGRNFASRLAEQMEPKDATAANAAAPGALGRA